MKRPAFQFYPADWRNNAKLRRCSWAARGAWMDVLGLLHDSDEYGVLRWPLKEIAQAIGCPPSLLRELADKEVLKGCDSGACEPYTYTARHAGKDGPTINLIDKQPGPIWYSSRFVRDEFVRTARGVGTRFGETPKPSPIPPIGEAPKVAPTQRQGDGASSSSSTSTTTPPTPTESPPPLPTASNSRGTRLPNGWTLPAEWAEFARADRPEWDDAHILRVSLMFRDHWLAAPGVKGVKVDWPGTWRNWVRRESSTPRSIRSGKSEQRTAFADAIIGAVNHGQRPDNADPRDISGEAERVA